jgi:hypothetical protein
MQIIIYKIKLVLRLLTFTYKKLLKYKWLFYAIFCKIYWINNFFIKIIVPCMILNNKL